MQGFSYYIYIIRACCSYSSNRIMVELIYFFSRPKNILTTLKRHAIFSRMRPASVLSLILYYYFFFLFAYMISAIRIRLPRTEALSKCDTIHSDNFPQNRVI